MYAGQQDIVMARQTQRVWQRMLSGRRLDLLNPSAVDIEIDDIAHGLAFVARWNGQTVGNFPYSVAEHSIFVAELFHRLRPRSEKRWRLAALLHDAPEYVIGDMVGPAKISVGPGYAEMDARLTEAIHRRFGLPGVIPDKIKRVIKAADRHSARLEAEQLAGFTQGEADRLFGKPLSADVPERRLQPHSPPVVKAMFLKAFGELFEG
ncbi:MAG: HD family hydrolase [Paracoccaceae bacterium]|nr:HD family hydrolase [Paracoccaceae bacterium]